MRSTFKILFYLKRNAPKKSGLVPVMCRITVNGKISQFSCKLDVEEKLWNVQSGKMSGKSLTAQEANRMLDKIRVGVTKAYQEICDKDNYVTAEKVRNAFLGMGQNHKTLLAVFRQHNEDYEKQVGKMKSVRSYWKYCTAYNHLEEFGKATLLCPLWANRIAPFGRDMIAPFGSNNINHLIVSTVSDFFV